MLTLNQKLVKQLSTVERPGGFYTSGTQDLILPKIQVTGLDEPLALPVLPQQAAALLKLAEQAPYGKGEETLVDTEVRNTWQIDAARVTITGAHWAGMLDKIVAQCALGLGVKGEVQADLYKLLLYPEGSFFVEHRDTEKADGMFATLVLSFPSIYSGGALCIEHAGQQVELTLQQDDPGVINFAAFYADCVHKVQPVTAGNRVVLVYNLCLREQRTLPTVPDYASQEQAVTSLLRDWVNGENVGDDEDIPLKLVYLLEHAYTPASLSFAALKNADAAAADVLLQAAQAAGCDVYLALMNVTEMGSAEYTGAYYHRGGRYWQDADDFEDEEDFEEIEVLEEHQYISDWLTVDGQQPDFGELAVEDEELCLPERLTRLVPDEQHFHEATGNEGASFERTYHRAALVMWPSQYAVDALAVAGHERVLGYLEQLQRSQSQQPLRAGLKRLLPYWDLETDTMVGVFSKDEQTRLTRLLLLVTPLQDTGLLKRVWRQVVERDSAYQSADNPALLAALASMQPAEAAELWLSFLKQRVPQWQQSLAYAELMRWGLPNYAPFVEQAVLQTLLQDVLANLGRQPTNLSEEYTLFIDYNYHPAERKPISPEAVLDVLIASALVEAELLPQALQALLSYPAINWDESLIPAALVVGETPDCPTEVATYLQKQCLAHVQQAIAEPLAAPSDWAREANFDCKDKDDDCKALQAFLLNPDQQSWAFAAAEARRKALEKLVQKHQLDVDMQTIKRGRPHTLQFSKNQNSYERRVRQRHLDEANQAKLLAVLQD